MPANIPSAESQTLSLPAVPEIGSTTPLPPAEVLEGQVVEGGFARIKRIGARILGAVDTLAAVAAVLDKHGVFDDMAAGASGAGSSRAGKAARVTATIGSNLSDYHGWRTASRAATGQNE